MTTICRRPCRRSKSQSALVVRRERAHHDRSAAIGQLEPNHEPNHVAPSRVPHASRNLAASREPMLAPNQELPRPARNESSEATAANGPSAKSDPSQNHAPNVLAPTGLAVIVRVTNVPAKIVPAKIVPAKIGLVKIGLVKTGLVKTGLVKTGLLKTGLATNVPSRRRRAASVLVPNDQNVPNARNVPNETTSRGLSGPNVQSVLAPSERNAPNEMTGLSAANVRSVLNDPNGASVPTANRRRPVIASDRPSRQLQKLLPPHNAPPAKSLPANRPKSSPRQPPAATRRRSPASA